MQNYKNKYRNIPLDYKERLEWMCNKYKISTNDMDYILYERDRRMNSLYYTSSNIFSTSEELMTFRMESINTKEATVFKMFLNEKDKALEPLDFVELSDSFHFSANNLDALTFKKKCSSTNVNK